LQSVAGDGADRITGDQGREIRTALTRPKG